MFSIIVWGLIGMILGSCVIGLGMIAGWIGGDQLRDRIGQWYIGLMMTVLGDGSLVAREQGGVELTTVDYSAKFGADYSVIGGDGGYLSDDLDVKTRLKSKPFGVSLESHAVYISPLLCEIAEYASEAKQESRIGYQPDGGMRLDFEIPETPQLPTLRDGHRILDGNCRRRFGEVAEDWTHKSQEMFHNRIDLGTTLMLLAAFGLGTGAAYLVVGHAPEGNSTTVPIIAMAMLPFSLGDRGLDDIEIDWQALGAITAGISTIVLLAVTALLVSGVWSMIAFLLAFVLFAPMPYMAVLLLKDAIPLNGVAANGFGILAQLTFGRGALTKTSEGPYEWHQLREDNRGMFTVLNNGDRVPIDGSSGELYRWGMAPLAITEQKDGDNVRQFEVFESPVDDDATRESRASKPVEHPEHRRSRTILMSLSKVQKVIRGSASSELVRRGRNKALEESGGTQQISTMMTMLLASALLVISFVLTAGVMML